MVGLKGLALMRFLVIRKKEKKALSLSLSLSPSPPPPPHTHRHLHISSLPEYILPMFVKVLELLGVTEVHMQ
jgi:hypothetical protein